MLQRKTLIIANWKMNLSVSQASHLVAQYHKHISGHRDIEVVIAPSLLALQPLSMEIDRRRFRLAAQNAYHKDSGGFTGEVSFAMLRDLVHYVIVGHSERRIYFHEANDVVRDKVAAAIRCGISPVLCVGETAHERAEGQTRQVLHDQLVAALSNITSEDLPKVVIAYEPVWAISNFGGQHARPEDIQKALDYTRKQLHDLFGAAAEKQTRLLYGGSVDDHNVRSYTDLDGCDGVLVGSASLKYHTFSNIATKLYQRNRERKESKES